MANYSTLKSSGGSSTFLDLTDTPSSFTNSTGKVIQVNSGATALEFGTVGADSPTITAVTPANYDGTDQTTFTITGTNFDVGTVVDFITASGAVHRASTTSIVTQGEITALTPQAFTASDGPLDVKVTTGGGLTVTSTDIIQTGGSPVWTTASGSLYENAHAADVTAGDNSYRLGMTLNETIVATDPESQAVTYSVESGSLPTNGTLNTATGGISGTLPTSLSGDTTYSFTAGATDSSGNLTTRAFNIIVKNALVTPFSKSSTHKWTYAHNVRHVSDLFDDIDNTFTDGIEYDNSGAANTAQKLAYGAYVKFNMLVGPSSTPKSCIAFINRNSTNNEWSLCSFDFGDHPLQGRSDGNTKQLRWVNTRSTSEIDILNNTNTSGGAFFNIYGRQSYNLANDDNDSSFLRADGSLILSANNSNSFTAGSFKKLSGGLSYWNNETYIASAIQSTTTGAPHFAQAGTSSTYTYSARSSIGYHGSVAAFLGTVGEVFFDFVHDKYYVSVILPNGTLHKFSPQNLSSLTGYSSISSTIFENLRNSGTNSRAIITDGFGQGILGRVGTSSGFYFEVDWVNGTLVNTSLKSATFSRYNATEEDVWGDVLHTVIGQKMIVREAAIYHTSGLGDNSKNISAAHANWKSDWAADTANLSSANYLHSKTTTSFYQQGMDLWAVVDSNNRVYFGDWGHDDGGSFNQGTDTYFTMQRTNIRRIPSNWY